jgi:Glucose inhibited division protein A
VALGFETDRLKTGTPSRVDARTIDYSVLESQPGDDEVRWFSFDPEVIRCGNATPLGVSSVSSCKLAAFGTGLCYAIAPLDASHCAKFLQAHVQRPQMSCHLTRTTAETHRLIEVRRRAPAPRCCTLCTQSHAFPLDPLALSQAAHDEDMHVQLHQHCTRSVHIYKHIYIDIC